jgi:seryl-tRNA synthetase
MLDLDFIRRHADRVRLAIAQKGVELDLDEVLCLDANLRSARSRLDALRAEKNSLSEGYAALPLESRAERGRRSGALSIEIRAAELNVDAAAQALQQRLLLVPNIPWEGAPVGPSDATNIVLRQEGTPPAFSFPSRDHIELVERNGWADLSRIARIAGSRTYCLKGRLALLEQALLFHVSSRMAALGFAPIAVPAIARERAFINTGHFPGGQEEAFQLPQDGLFLAGTAEVALTSLHSGEILHERDLPILYAGISPCFRREAGSAGRDVRGLMRVHQFYKVEQYVICRADVEESALWHARLLANAEAVLRELQLPYQVVECSTGDMGPGKVRQNDLETWIPSLGRYRETHSCSTLHDWQARRARLRYRDRGGKVRFAHTLNNTAVATPRILVPLLENHQTADGGVTLPTCLRAYFGGDLRL